MLLPLVGALSLSFLVGCGNDNSSGTVQTTGRVYAAVTNGAISNGNVNVLGTSNTLQVFTGVNNNQSSTGPSASLSLSSEPEALALDVSRDRLYVGTVTTASSSQLLVFNTASQIGSGSTAVVSLTVPGIVISESYDAARDVLYMGFIGGGVLRIASASALSTATASAQQLTGISNLNAILDDSTNDRLITAASAAATGPVVNLPVFTSASSGLFAPATPLGVPGVVNAIDTCFGDNGNLLVLDSGSTASTFGSSTTRILRYPNDASNFSTSPTLSISLGGSNCIAYDSSLDDLFVGQSNGQITVFNSESSLSGTQPSAGTFNLVSNPTAQIFSLAVDPTR
jgi:hypothetical protein